MNASEHERFHELAHKTLAGEATSSEREELQALLAAHPPLQEEMSKLGKESALMRELLPMLEDLRQPARDIPPPPRERLRRDLAAVFRGREETAERQLVTLLRKLREALGGQPVTGREEFAKMVGRLRDWLDANEFWPRQGAGWQAETQLLSLADLCQSLPDAREMHLEMHLEMCSEFPLPPGPPADPRARLAKQLEALEARIVEPGWGAAVSRKELSALLPMLEKEAEPPPGGKAG